MLTRAVVKPVSPAIAQEEKKKGQGHKDRYPLIPNPLPLFLYSWPLFTATGTHKLVMRDNRLGYPHIAAPDARGLHVIGLVL